MWDEAKIKTIAFYLNSLGNYRAVKLEATPLWNPVIEKLFESYKNKASGGKLSEAGGHRSERFM